MSEKQSPSPEKLERAAAEKRPTKDPSKVTKGLGKAAIKGSNK